MLTFLKKFFKPKHPPEQLTAPYKIEAPVTSSPVKVAVVAPVAETTVNTEVNQIAVAAPVAITPAELQVVAEICDSIHDTDKPAKVKKAPAKPRAPRKSIVSTETPAETKKKSKPRKPKASKENFSFWL